MRKAFLRIINLGVSEDMEPDKAKYIRMSNLGSLLMILVNIPYMLLCRRNGWNLILAELFALNALLACTLLINKSWRHLFAAAYFGTLLNFHLVFVTVAMGRETLLPLLIFFTAGGAITLIGRGKKLLIIATVALIFLGYQAALLLERFFGPLYRLTRNQTAELKSYVEYTVFVMIVVNAVIARFGAISAEDRLKAERERAATHDGLTGLLNHSGWEKEARRDFDRLSRYGGTASLAFLDLDDFKAVNDAHGHQAGDEVLIALARMMNKGLRASDLAGRYGGEEFVILLSGSSGEIAIRTIERILKEFSSGTVLKDGSACTFSAGVVEINDAKSIGIAEFLLRADTAMYRAKRAGKNRVVLWEEAKKDAEEILQAVKSGLARHR